MSRKLEEKQARREAEERKRAEQRKAARRRNLVTVGIALLVGAAVVALVLSDRADEGGPVGVGATAAGCSEVEEFEAAEAQHIEEGAAHEEYNSSPPTNGPHYGVAAQAGFYSSPLEPEQLVHNLEHGQIVFWYSPDAPDEVVDDIEAIVEDDAIGALVAVPYEGELEGNFAMTAWTKEPDAGEHDHGTGHLMTCERVSQSVVDDFRTEFQGKSPERLTPPFEG